MRDEAEKAAVEPVTAKAYRVLERLIVTLELAPSTTTTEGALIDRLGLGRTPVREAIQRLAWEGLLEVRPRGVAPQVVHDHLELAFRARVEGHVRAHGAQSDKPYFHTTPSGNW